MKQSIPRIVSLIALTLTLISCSKSQEARQNFSYCKSTSDSIHAHKIEQNLIPMYSIKGMVERSTIPEMMHKDSIPGLSMVFVDNGEIAWAKHYGYANLSDSSRVSAETVFAGASLSKPITAYAALNLVDKDSLNLDEDVNQELKTWKVPENEFTQRQKVTLRRLINHSAGIKNDLWTSYMPNEQIPTLDQLLSGEKPSIDPSVSVVFKPGSRTKYSNPGYAVIQRLLMDEMKDEFDDIIRSLVFEPAQMNNSSFEQPIPKRLMNNRATGYSRKLEAYPYKVFPYEATGGIWTRADDLAKFMITILNDYHLGSNKIVSKELSQAIFNKQDDRFVFSMWNWGDDIVFRHTGSNQGFNCLIYGSVNKNQGLVVMTNSDNAFGLFDYIQRAVNKEYQWEYVIPESLEPVTKNISWVDKYLGDYWWRGYDLTLHKKNEELILTIDDEDYNFTQVGDQKFICNEGSLKLSFSDDKESYFYGMTLWGPEGGPTILEKVADGQ